MEKSPLRGLPHSTLKPASSPKAQAIPRPTVTPHQSPQDSTFHSHNLYFLPSEPICGNLVIPRLDYILPSTQFTILEPLGWFPCLFFLRAT